jgi:hypothetical protein
VGELTDQQLEAVAGGWSVTDGCGTCGCYTAGRHTCTQIAGCGGCES